MKLPSILILGAGLAGLSAAETLSDAGSWGVARGEI